MIFQILRGNNRSDAGIKHWEFETAVLHVDPSQFGL